MSITTAKITILFIFFLLTIFACEKDDGLTGERVSFYYEETAANDPWEDKLPTSDAELQVLVSDYLNKNLGIQFSNLRITQDGTADGCFAPHCRTGRIIRIEADKAYQDILVENGF